MEREIPLVPAVKKGMPSTAIRRYKYDLLRRVLKLEYVGGGRYHYYGVDADSYIGLERAASKGRYVNLYIKPRFPYSRED